MGKGDKLNKPIITQHHHAMQKEHENGLPNLSK